MSGSRSAPIILAAAALLAAEVCGAASIEISSATVQRLSDPARVCVGLALAAEERVAGTENLIVWDGSCATIRAETCAANPAHGKQLSGSLQAQREFTYKALVLSLTDTDPMPAGDLYCCDFTVHVDNLGDCCQLRIESPGASDPQGNALPTTAGNPGQVCLAADGETPGPTSTPIPTSTPSLTPSPGAPTVVASPPPPPTSTSGQPSITRTATPSAQPSPTRPGSAGGDDDGCAVTAGNSFTWAPWLSAVALFVLRRRRA